MSISWRIFSFFLAFLQVYACYAEVIIHQDLNGNEAITDKTFPPLFVSLGSNCDVAYSLEFSGLRHAAFPLDWLLTIDGNKFIELIENGFQHFLDEEFLAWNNHVLVNSYYHIEFRHDFEPLPELREKYQRRIDRFYKLNEYQGKVFFIRIPYIEATNPTLYWPNEEALQISTDWANRLNSVLKKCFPNLDFILVITNIFDENDESDLILTDNILRINLAKYPRTDHESLLSKKLLKYVNDPKLALENKH